MKIKIGIGYDVHQLAEGYEFWLGGIKIDHSKGAVGHSDADVLIHAICDALLGAANLRDIGYHFSDTSSEFKGIDSKILLKRVIELIKEKGYRVGNIDSIIILQKPKSPILYRTDENNPCSRDRNRPGRHFNQSNHNREVRFYRVVKKELPHKPWCLLRRTKCCKHRNHFNWLCCQNLLLISLIIMSPLQCSKLLILSSTIMTSLRD